MRNILFILLLCNVMLLKAQSLKLEHWRIINSSEIADADAKVELFCIGYFSTCII